MIKPLEELEEAQLKVSPATRRSMASAAMPTDGLPDFEKLALDAGSQDLPGCYPEYNPVDIYRAHLSRTLSELSGIDAAAIYPLIHWTLTLDKGDLTLAVPALKIKGEKPTDLAEKWVKEVRCRDHRVLLCANVLYR